MPDPQPPSPEVFDKYSDITHPDAFPEALSLLKSLLTDSTIKWESNGDRNGVELYYYQPDPPLPAPICRGVGTFPAGLTAEQILPTIHQIACRKNWDERFKLGFPLLRYSRKLVRFYAVQKGVGEGWFTIVSPRDFTGYSGHVREVGDDGVTRNFYLQTSAEFEDVPDVEGFVRGWTNLAGWVLEEKAGEPVKCSYIVKFDPKGSIPANLVAQVVKDTPACIDKVRTFIEKNGLVPYVNMHDEFPGQLRQEVLVGEETEINPENGEKLNDAGFRLTFSWFGAVGSFDINFDERWENGVKIDVEEGTIDEDLELKSTKGKVTVTVKEGGKDKKLKLIVSKA
ncbi:hypothetical protein H072_11288 [Dactylellina haptotyla CBS 200.50]|uniref:START domain-containing protein n=1 Tax=Dactylellina haptotyla (strain CBS 200.50) TaxID=1284197 RepID=S7ZX84_DACHA|nr:hypothetical protein H072_11288 [Dactylellina haptotyla CBS 200.50]